MSSHQEALRQLKAHPMARFHRPNAALPKADDDPHPAQTLALYKLWTSLRKYLAMDDKGVPFIVSQGNISTPLQILQAVDPLFVSRFNQLFHISRVDTKSLSRRSITTFLPRTAVLRIRLDIESNSGSYGSFISVPLRRPTRLRFF